MSRKANLIINILATLVYIVAANPLVTGWPVHEWVSLGLILILIIHCVAHYDWIIKTIKGRTERASVARLVLDVATLVVFMVVTVSGLMVSRVVLPLIGLVGQGYFFWNPVHSISAKVLLALLVVHIAVNWKWFWQFVKKKQATQGTTETPTEQKDQR